jgi:hypothetical protein
MNQSTHTPQQLWRTRFDEPANDTTMAAVYKYAASISRQVEASTRKRDPMSIDDRVQSAIVGTLEGRLTWDPDRIDLARHLISAIWTALTHEVRHAKKFPHVSIDDEAQNVDDLDEQMTRALTVQRESPDESAIASGLSESLSQLRVLAGQDRSVLEILSAYANGYTEKPDVMNVTGMSSRAYHNARQRLVRLAKKFPVDVRAAAIQPIA